MLHKRLKELRKEFKMTQFEISEKINIPSSTYANWEQGTRTPDYEILVKIADIFNCTVDYLLGRTDSKNVEILSGDKLPPELRGIIDAIGILKGTGLSNQDIQELLEMQAKLRKKI